MTTSTLMKPRVICASGHEFEVVESTELALRCELISRRGPAKMIQLHMNECPVCIAHFNDSVRYLPDDPDMDLSEFAEMQPSPYTGQITPISPAD